MADISEQQECLKCGLEQCKTKRMYNITGKDIDPKNSEILEIPGTYQYIKNLMKLWKSNSELQGWCYHIEFLNKINSKTIIHCLYEVKWTKPMTGYRYPIITVNVYIFLKIDSESSNLMSMKYVFDGSHFIHDANYIFNPYWLFHAYKNKKTVAQSLKCIDDNISQEEEPEETDSLGLIC